MQTQAEAHDLRLRYWGKVFSVEALSARGKDWLGQRVGAEEPGPVQIRLQFLDEFVDDANEAGLVLDVPSE
jgi:hypothetical protein